MSLPSLPGEQAEPPPSSGLEPTLLDRAFQGALKMEPTHQDHLPHRKLGQFLVPFFTLRWVKTLRWILVGRYPCTLCLILRAIRRPRGTARVDGQEDRDRDRSSRKG